MLGSNSAQVTLNAGGSVYVGPGNSGNVSVNGGTGSVAVNGSNTAQITMNNGGSVQIDGNTGNVSLNGGSLTYAGSKTGNINANNNATVTHARSLTLTAPAAPSSSAAELRQHVSEAACPALRSAWRIDRTAAWWPPSTT